MQVSNGRLTSAAWGVVAAAAAAAGCFDPELRCPVVCNDRLGCPSGRRCTNSVCRGPGDGCPTNPPKLCSDRGCVTDREQLEPLIKLWLDSSTLPTEEGPLLAWLDRTGSHNNALASFPGGEPRVIYDSRWGRRAVKFLGPENGLRVDGHPGLRLGTSEFVLMVAASAIRGASEIDPVVVSQTDVRSGFTLGFEPRDGHLGLVAHLHNGAPCASSPREGAGPAPPPSPDCPSSIFLVAPARDPRMEEDSHAISDAGRVLILRRSAGMLELRAAGSPPAAVHPVPATFDLSTTEPIRVGSSGAVGGFWGAVAGIMLVVGSMTPEQGNALEQFFVQQYQ
jgi:hypothetical protein